MEQISKKEHQSGKVHHANPAAQDLTTMIVNDINKFNHEAKGRKGYNKNKKNKDLHLFDNNVDLIVLEYIRQELHTKE